MIETNRNLASSERSAAVETVAAGLLVGMANSLSAASQPPEPDGAG